MTPPLEVTAGFPEMWKPVHDRYRLFFEAAMKVQPLVNEMLREPVTGELADIVAPLVFASCNSMGAMLTLFLNGYGHNAMKLARSIYEVEINTLWLRKHPEEVRDFLDFNIIQQKEIWDTMDEERQQAVPVQRRDKMMEEFKDALQRFGVGKGKTRAEAKKLVEGIPAAADLLPELKLEDLNWQSDHPGDLEDALGSTDVPW